MAVELAYLIAPYRRHLLDPEDTSSALWRYCALNDVLAQVGMREPYREVEVLGDHAIALLEGTTEEVAAAGQLAGVHRIPLVDPATSLSALTKQERDALRDVALGLGYTLDELRAWTGRGNADVGTLTLFQFLSRLATRRVPPRWDRGRGELVFDRAPIPTTRAVPLPPLAGGAFGDSAALLDAFTYSDGDLTSALTGGKWTQGIVGSSGVAVEIHTNRVRAKSSLGSAYWTGSGGPWGPNVEVYITYLLGSSQSSLQGVYARLNGATGDGYVVFWKGGSADAFDVYRADAGVGTLLGASITGHSPSDGNLFGMSIIGSTITVYANTGAGFTARGTRSDSTYTAAGTVAVQAQNTVHYMDDLFVGTIGGATPVGRSVAASWNVRAAAGAPRVLSHDVRALVTGSRAASWDVRALAGASRVLSYDVAATAGGSRLLGYDVRATVAGERTPSWDVAGLAGAERALSYDVAVLAGADRLAAWNVRALAGADRSLAYDVATLVGANRSSLWNAAALVAAERVLLYDVLTSGVVGRSVALAYDVLATAGASRSAAWDVRNSVGAARALAFDVRVAVAAERVLSYAVRALVGREGVAAWHVAGLVAASRLAEWDVRTLAGAQRALAWDVAALVGVERVLAWDLLALAGMPPPLTILITDHPLATLTITDHPLAALAIADRPLATLGIADHALARLGVEDHPLATLTIEEV